MRNLLFFCALLAPAAGLACGGLFCSTGPGAAPVDQTGERILFEVEGDRVCATVEIAYTGAPEAFAWVVPVPAPPEVSDGDAALLNALAAATDLKWQFPAADNAGCPWPSYGSGGGCGCGFASDDGGGESGGGGPEEIPPPLVEVYGRQQTDTYEAATIGAERADDLVAWLGENAFNVSENMVPAMQPYVDEGMLFLAIKLRAGRDAAQIKPIRFCYEAAAPQIPLRLTAVAAQPQLAIQVFVVAYTLFSPVGDVVEQPDPATLAFNAWGEVSYPAWQARQSAHQDGRFWSLEYAGQTPELSVQDLPDGPPCNFEGPGCEGGRQCVWIGRGSNAQCLEPCFEDPCGAGEACFNGYCIPAPRVVRLGPWLTRYTTRINPEDMNHDPVFVATPERAAYDGVVDLSERSHLIQCYETLEERLPSACAFTYCGEGAQCVNPVHGRAYEAACDCAEDQVAVAVPQPDGSSFKPTCVPEENTVGVAPEDGGDPCATFSCGLGECVARGGFATCRCHENAFAFADFNGLRCDRFSGGVTAFEEGANPEAGNRDDAPITTVDPRQPGLPAMAFVLLVAAGLLRRRRL